MNKDLIKYITDAKTHGLTEQEIKQNLLDAGWDAAEVEESFTQVKLSESKTTVSMAPASQVTIQQAVTTPNNKQPDQLHASLASIIGNKQTAPQQQATPAAAPAIISVDTPWYKKPAFLIIPIIIIALGVGGYFAYGKYGDQITKTLTNTWNKITKKTSSEITQLKGGSIYQNDFKISYHDPLTYQDTGDSFSDGFFEKLKDFTVSFEGNFYVDTSNTDNPESSSKVTYTFGSGNTNFSTGLEYKFINKTLYVNTGDNPLLSSAVNSGFYDDSTSTKITWIKLDLPEIQKQFSENDQEGYKQVKEFFDPSLRTDLNKLWEDSKLVKVGSTVGKENINGVSTIHYKNILDKEAVKKLLEDYALRLAQAAGNQITDSDIQTTNIVISALVDKLEVKEFETWVGESDYHLYKVHLITNAPSLVSVIKELSNSNFDMGGSSADAKRLADVRQMASALELYYNDMGGYPDANNGIPKNLSPTYIGLVPVAPPATGNCSEYYNSYWYQPMGTKTTTSDGKTVYSSYQFTFCLENNIGGYQAGIGMLSPTGIKGNIACPSNDDKCPKSGPIVSPDETLQKQVQDTINKIDYSAQFSIDASYHDYDKKLTLDVPEGAYDVLTALRIARSKARDAKRIADVRQFSAGLELYFNDKNSYPKKLEDMTPMYIGVVPVAPTPPDGPCTEATNAYSYVLKNAQDYTLSFCIGANTGGYNAGVHTLSPQGIK